MSASTIDLAVVDRVLLKVRAGIETETPRQNVNTSKTFGIGRNGILRKFRLPIVANVAYLRQRGHARPFANVADNHLRNPPLHSIMITVPAGSVDGCAIGVILASECLMMTRLVWPER